MENRILNRRQRMLGTQTRVRTAWTEAEPEGPIKESLDCSLTEAKIPAQLVYDLDQKSLYINRELSLLAFQDRVLNEARDAQNPILERTNFLSIVSSNLDEFFMVRVAGLREQVVAGVLDLPPDGLIPEEQLIQIRQCTCRLISDMRNCFHQNLLPQLAKEGIFIIDYKELSSEQRRQMERFFKELVLPSPKSHDH